MPEATAQLTSPCKVQHARQRCLAVRLLGSEFVTRDAPPTPCPCSITRDAIMTLVKPTNCAGRYTRRSTVSERHRRVLRDLWRASRKGAKVGSAIPRSTGPVRPDGERKRWADLLPDGFDHPPRSVSLVISRDTNTCLYPTARFHHIAAAGHTNVNCTTCD